MTQNSTAILILLGVGALVLFFAMQRSGASAMTPRLVPLQYSNLERWEIIRDPKGHISQIVVHRDARVNNAG